MRRKTVPDPSQRKEASYTYTWIMDCAKQKIPNERQLPSWTMLIHWYGSATSHRNRNSCRWYWCGCKRLQIRTVLVEVSVHSNELISCPESAWTWMLNCWKWRRRYCKWLENAYDSCLKVKVSCWNVSWNYQVWTIFYNEQFSVQNGDPGAPATCAAVKHRRSSGDYTTVLCCYGVRLLLM